MDGVAGHAQDGTLGEEFARNVQAALWNDTGEADGRGGMQAKGFVDDCFKVRKSFDDFRRRDRVVLVSQSFVEFDLELRLGVGVQGEVVSDSTGGTGMPFR